MKESKTEKGKQRGRKRLHKENAAHVIPKKAKDGSFLPVPSLPTTQGMVLTVGQGDIGQLGLGPDVLEKSRPAVVSLPESVVDIAAGAMHTVCLTATGQVYTFGCNDDCALGRHISNDDEQTKPGKVVLPEKIVAVSAGDSHCAALGGSGNVYVWGNFRDSNGSMGLTLKGPQTDPIQILKGTKVVQVASGSDHLVCLSEKGIIYTCGNGEQGQLGRIHRHNVDRGGRRGLGLFLSPEPVRVGRKSAPIEFDRIWTSSYATFAREKERGTIYGFGLNNYNQLGFRDNELRYLPERIESFSGKTWLFIHGGQHHTLALDEAGIVYSMGRHDYGRLGLGDKEDKHEPTVIPTLRDQVCKHIACGNVVSFAVSTSGIVYSWGMGDNDQLGHGSDEDVLLPQAITSKSLSSKFAIKVSGGGQHSVILATEAETK